MVLRPLVHDEHNAKPYRLNRTWTDVQLKAALEAAGAPQCTSNGITTIADEEIREAPA